MNDPIWMSILKVGGSVAAILGFVVICGRLWNNAARDRLIEAQQSQLTAATDTVTRIAAENTMLRSREKELEIEKARLEARPDMTTLQKIMEAQSQNFKDVASMLSTHSDSVLKVFSQIEKSLAIHTTYLSALVERKDAA